MQEGIPPANNSCRGNKSARKSRRKLFCRPTLEQLEDRITPYVLSAYSWANTNISASFAPDGTWDTGYQSNLFALYNAAYPTATWQLQFAKALQTWADSSALNFHFVSDDGSPSGMPGLAQGDPRFGDIRYFASSGLATVGGAWAPSPSSTLGGDVTLNGTLPDPITSNPDLYSVVLHETGIALGLGELTPALSVLNNLGPFTGLYPDDIAGIQALYGVRPLDTASHSLASPTPLTISSGNAGTARVRTGVTLNANIDAVGTIDYYQVTLPAGSDGTLSVSVDARALSLFQPKVEVFDAAGRLLASASAGTYGSVATVNLTGLTAGHSYILEAAGASTDVFGMGAYKLSAQFGTGASVPIVPTVKAPVGLTASAVSTSQVNLSWTASDANATGYVIDRSTDGVNWSPVARITSGSTSYADDTVSPGLSYDYLVYAANGTTLSNPSNIASATLVPQAPAALTATAVSSSQINLSWSDVTGETGFTIERSTNGFIWSQIATSTAGVTSYQDTGLNAGSTYLYEVDAVNAGGHSNWSNQASATTFAAPLAPAPPSLSAWAVSSSQVDLSWTESSANVTGYEVDRSLDGVTWTILASVAGTTFADASVSAGLSYDYRVCAVNGTLVSSPSPTANVTLAPLAPAILTAAAVSPSQINLAWSDVVGETGFTILRSSDGASWTQTAVVTAGITSYRDTGLTAGATYYYRLSANNLGGNSPTHDVTATTVSVDPGAPTGLTASAVSSSQIDLTWNNMPGETSFMAQRSNHSNLTLNNGPAALATSQTGLTLNNGPGALATSQTGLTLNNGPGETTYVIERSPDGVNAWAQIAVTANGVTWFQNTGLDAGHTYFYRIRASTAVGLSDPSTQASASTIPPPPLGLSATAVSASQINLAWSDVTGETGFRIERSLNGVNWTRLASTAANVTGFQDTGLRRGTVYYYRVRATNASGTSAPSGTVWAVPGYIPIFPQSLSVRYFY